MRRPDFKEIRPKTQDLFINTMDRIIDQLPFFTPEHRNLAQDLLKFVNIEIEPHAIEERDVDESARHYVGVMARRAFLIIRWPRKRNSTIVPYV